MGWMQSALSILMAVMMVVMSPDLGQARKMGGSKQQSDRVARDFRHADVDGDHKLDAVEWRRRGNFERLDRNADGYLSLEEVRALYRGHDDRTYAWGCRDR